MSLLGNVISNLPKTIAGSAVASAASTTVASLSTKLAEAASKIGTDFATLAPWTSLGANTATFKQVQDSTTTTLAELNNSGQTVTAQERADILALFSTDTTTNAVTASQIKTLTGGGTSTSNHQVKLVDPSGASVVFIVMPEIVESHSVQYEAVSPPQGPGSFQKYKGTDSTQWTINATFIARTSEEATQRLTELNTLRAWKMPYFGGNTGDQFPTKLGAPPAVLTLSGFRGRLVGPVPVVITSLNWNWPSDVDYIPTTVTGDDGLPVPFPTVMRLAINVVESFSAVQFNNFSLADFYRGDMVSAFSSATSAAYSPVTYETTQPVQSAVVSTSATKTAPAKTEATASERTTTAGLSSMPNLTIVTSTDGTTGQYDELGNRIY